MERFLLVAAALVVSGCGFRTADEFIISPEFSPEQQELIVSAADEWCEAVGTCVPVSVGEPANVLLVDECSEPGRHGEASISPTRGPIIKICNTEFLRVAVLHEMGHALYGDPSHTESGVMSLPWDGTEHLTDKDVDYAHGTGSQSM